MPISRLTCYLNSDNSIPKTQEKQSDDEGIGHLLFQILQGDRTIDYTAASTMLQDMLDEYPLDEIEAAIKEEIEPYIALNASTYPNFEFYFHLQLSLLLRETDYEAIINKIDFPKKKNLLQLTLSQESNALQLAAQLLSTLSDDKDLTTGQLCLVDRYLPLFSLTIGPTEIYKLYIPQAQRLEIPINEKEKDDFLIYFSRLLPKFASQKEIASQAVEACSSINVDSYLTSASLVDNTIGIWLLLLEYAQSHSSDSLIKIINQRALIQACSKSYTFRDSIKSEKLLGGLNRILGQPMTELLRTSEKQSSFEFALSIAKMSPSYLQLSLELLNMEFIKDPSLKEKAFSEIYPLYPQIYRLFCKETFCDAILTKHSKIIVANYPFFERFCPRIFYPEIIQRLWINRHKIPSEQRLDVFFCYMKSLQKTNNVDLKIALFLQAAQEFPQLWEDMAFYLLLKDLEGRPYDQLDLCKNIETASNSHFKKSYALTKRLFLIDMAHSLAGSAISKFRQLLGVATESKLGECRIYLCELLHKIHGFEMPLLIIHHLVALVSHQDVVSLILQTQKKDFLEIINYLAPIFKPQHDKMLKESIEKFFSCLFPKLIELNEYSLLFELLDSLSEGDLTKISPLVIAKLREKFKPALLSNTPTSLLQISQANNVFTLLLKDASNTVKVLKSETESLLRMMERLLESPSDVVEISPWINALRDNPSTVSTFSYDQRCRLIHLCRLLIPLDINLSLALHSALSTSLDTDPQWIDLSKQILNKLITQNLPLITLRFLNDVYPNQLTSHRETIINSLNQLSFNKSITSLKWIRTLGFTHLSAMSVQARHNFVNVTLENLSTEQEKDECLQHLLSVKVGDELNLKIESVVLLFAFVSNFDQLCHLLALSKSHLNFVNPGTFQKLESVIWEKVVAFAHFRNIDRLFHVLKQHSDALRKSIYMKLLNDPTKKFTLKALETLAIFLDQPSSLISSHLIPYFQCTEEVEKNKKMIQNVIGLFLYKKTPVNDLLALFDVLISYKDDSFKKSYIALGLILLDVTEVDERISKAIARLQSKLVENFSEKSLEELDVFLSHPNLLNQEVVILSGFEGIFNAFKNALAIKDRISMRSEEKYRLLMRQYEFFQFAVKHFIVLRFVPTFVNSLIELVYWPANAFNICDFFERRYIQVFNLYCDTIDHDAGLEFIGLTITKFTHYLANHQINTPIFQEYVRIIDTFFTELRDKEVNKRETLIRDVIKEIKVHQNSRHCLYAFEVRAVKHRMLSEDQVSVVLKRPAKIKEPSCYSTYDEKEYYAILTGQKKDNTQTLVELGNIRYEKLFNRWKKAQPETSQEIVKDFFSMICSKEIKINLDQVVAFFIEILNRFEKCDLKYNSVIHLIIKESYQFIVHLNVKYYPIKYKIMIFHLMFCVVKFHKKALVFQNKFDSFEMNVFNLRVFESSLYFFETSELRDKADFSLCVIFDLQLIALENALTDEERGKIIDVICEMVIRLENICASYKTKNFFAIANKPEAFENTNLLFESLLQKGIVDPLNQIKYAYSTLNRLNGTPKDDRNFVVLRLGQ